MFIIGLFLSYYHIILRPPPPPFSRGFILKSTLSVTFSFNDIKAKENTKQSPAKLETSIYYYTRKQFSVLVRTLTLFMCHRTNLLYDFLILSWSSYIFLLNKGVRTWVRNPMLTEYWFFPPAFTDVLVILSCHSKQQISYLHRNDAKQYFILIFINKKHNSYLFGDTDFPTVIQWM